MEGHQGFFLTIGNGGGVELKLNGESLGIPGKAGKVVRLRIPKDAEPLRVSKPPRQAEAGEGVLEGDKTPEREVLQEVSGEVSQEASGEASGEVPGVRGEEREDDGLDR